MQSKEQLEVRDRFIQLIHPFGGKGVSLKLNQAITTIFSSAFHHYLNKNMTLRQVKIFTAENILKNIINQNQLIHQDWKAYKQLDDLIRDSLTYLSYQYPIHPCSQEQITAQRVRQIDNSDALANSYFSNTDIVFQHRENSGNYNDVIMRLINQITTKVNQQVKNQKTSIQLFAGLGEDEGTVNRKLPLGLPLFSEKQIQNNYLIIKDHSVLKLLTQWAAQLWQKFTIKNYFTRKSQNCQLPKCKKINNLQHWMKSQLDEEMDKERIQIQAFIKQLHFELYSDLKQKIDTEAKKYEGKHPLLNKELQVYAGKIALNSVNNFHSITIKYLNRLIHGLLAVSARFFKRQELSKSAWPEPPNLISFKIGDILKKKIETEHIFTTISEIQKSNQFKIVRVQNRLNTAFRDVLVNVKLLDSFVSEITLKSSQKHISQFQKSSNHFHTYINNLLQASLGPIHQLSFIWNKYDPRHTYYSQVLLKQLIKNPAKEQIDESSILSKFPENLRLKLSKRITSTDDVFPQFGVCLFKKPLNITKTSKVQFFRYFQDAQTSYLVGKSQKGIYLIEDINTLLKHKQFLDNHFVFELTNGSQTVNISQHQIKKQFLLPNYVKRCYSKSKETISLINNQLNDSECINILKGAKQQKSAVINLFLTDNNVTRCDYYADDYPNLQWLELNRTQMKDYTLIDHLTNIKILILDKCPLETIPIPVCYLYNLQVLTISESQISSLPDQVINWKSLKHIQLDFNKLTSLPDSFMHCSKLNVLNLDGNAITHLPEKISQLKNLQKLFLGGNQLSNLPDGLFELHQIKQVHIKNNKFALLSQQFGKLQNLQVLDVSGNQLQIIPASFYSLTNLIKFNAKANKLGCIHQFWQKWTKIQFLDISQNPTIQKIECLEWLTEKGNQDTKVFIEQFKKRA